MLCLMWRKFRSDEEDGEGDRWVEVISWEPRAFVYHNFLVSLLNFGSYSVLGLFLFFVPVTCAKISLYFVVMYLSKRSYVKFNPRF